MKHKRRKDYITNRRRLFKALKKNYEHMMIPFYPAPKMTNRRLAEELGVSERTIRRHKKTIKPKQWDKLQTTIWDGYYELYG